MEFLLHVLENEESAEAQAIVCVGISKLMLSGMISDERVRASVLLLDGVCANIAMRRVGVEEPCSGVHLAIYAG